MRKIFVIFFIFLAIESDIGVIANIQNNNHSNFEKNTISPTFSHVLSIFGISVKDNKKQVVIENQKIGQIFKSMIEKRNKGKNYLPSFFKSNSKTPKNEIFEIQNLVSLETKRDSLTTPYFVSRATEPEDDILADKAEASMNSRIEVENELLVPVLEFVDILLGVAVRLITLTLVLAYINVELCKKPEFDFTSYYGYDFAPKYLEEGFYAKTYRKLLEQKQLRGRPELRTWTNAQNKQPELVPAVTDLENDRIQSFPSLNAIKRFQTEKVQPIPSAVEFLEVGGSWNCSSFWQAVLSIIFILLCIGALIVGGLGIKKV